MASTSEKNLFCPICQEVFKEPVLLICSHSFCKDCLRSCWREKPTQECPVCKRRSSRSDPPRNLFLKNLCEAYVQQREKTSAEQVCPVHSERLRLFCLTDQQPVCVVCRDSKAHEDHRFRPIEEAAQDLRDELNKSLLPLKENLQKAKDLKEKYNGIAFKIQHQFKQAILQIHDQLKKLHQFLAEENMSRMKALREEEAQKTQRMKDKMAALSREIEALSENIRTTEEQLRAPDVSFLLKYKAAVERVQHRPLLEEEPQLDPGALIDRAKHLGNLSFNIWTNMKRLVQFTPVILDPNTAINAAVSEDLTSFTQEDNPAEKEEQDTAFVFGSEGFDSGTHSWDVEVGDSDDWACGIQKCSGVFGRGENTPSDAWVLTRVDGTYAAVRHIPLGKFAIPLQVKSKPRRIRVRLNCGERRVSFYDLDANAHMHTFTLIKRTKLLPCFFTRSKRPIRILSLALQTLKIPKQVCDDVREKSTKL